MKKYLLTGLLILVPLVVTLWVLNLIVGTMDQVLLLLPEHVRRDNIVFRIPGIGVVLTIAVVFVVGLLAHNFIGRQLVAGWESLLARIPIVRSIYSSVKQVSDTIFSPQGQAFRKAVLVEWPRKDAWTIGFIVGAPGDEIGDAIGRDFETVYVPTTPNPTSGYLAIVSTTQLRDLAMSVDEALKFVISLGVVSPSKSNPRTTPGPEAVRNPAG